MSEPIPITPQMLYEVIGIWYVLGVFSCLFWGIFLRGGFKGFLRDVKDTWSLVFAPVVCGILGPCLFIEGFLVWYFIQRPIELEKKNNV